MILQSQPVDEARRQAVRAFFDGLTAGAFPPALFAPAPLFWTTLSGPMVGNAYFRVPAMLARIFPDGLNFTVEELILEGERAAAAVRSEGRFDGDSLYSNDYAFFFNFVGAQISSVAEHFNPLRVSPALSERMRVALAD